MQGKQAYCSSVSSEGEEEKESGVQWKRPLTDWSQLLTRANSNNQFYQRNVQYLSASVKIRTCLRLRGSSWKRRQTTAIGIRPCCWWWGLAFYEPNDIHYVYISAKTISLNQRKEFYRLPSSPLSSLLSKVICQRHICVHRHKWSAHTLIRLSDEILKVGQTWIKTRLL